MIKMKKYSHFVTIFAGGAPCARIYISKKYKGTFWKLEKIYTCGSIDYNEELNNIFVQRANNCMECEEAEYDDCPFMGNKILKLPRGSKVEIFPYLWEDDYFKRKKAERYKRCFRQETSN